MVLCEPELGGAGGEKGKARPHPRALARSGGASAVQEQACVSRRDAGRLPLRASQFRLRCGQLRDGRATAHAGYDPASAEPRHGRPRATSPWGAHQQLEEAALEFAHYDAEGACAHWPAQAPGIPDPDPVVAADPEPELLLPPILALRPETCDPCEHRGARTARDIHHAGERRDRAPHRRQGLPLQGGGGLRPIGGGSGGGGGREALDLRAQAQDGVA
mmetsp:Transcript_17672/g.41810  ORF Transcript_17672/g.41810 Transcript_17672/m.41810 type:complete len:218 (+) Transcript_17672:290-943(+)